MFNRLPMILLSAVAAIATALYLIFSGAPNPESPESGGAGGEASLEKVTFLTDWIPQAEHGGFYMAKALGLYEDAGLEVVIRPGGAGVNVPQLLAARAVDFAMGSNSFIPLNMTRQGVPAKAIMAVFQKDPQVLITHPRDDITSIADMKGKPIMISDATRTAWWPWLEGKFGFEESQIRRYSGTVAPFLADPQSIQQGYVTSEPYLIARELGQEPQVYLLADEGYPSYATLVMTRDETIAERPDTVRAFVQASAEGWRRYLSEDPAPAHALIQADNPDMSEDLMMEARRRMISFAIVSGADDAPIGTMTADRWQTFYDEMAEAGLFEGDMDVSQAYTLDFVPR